jgi:RNA-directed DNA polymerase
MNSMHATNKPFNIDKRLVYEAYKAVKSNRGAAGVDEQSIEQFEEDLAGNLYKIWNRMSSGTYFPPPVRAVPIPKKSGGERILGVPTVADRVAQMVVKQVIEPTLEPIFLAQVRHHCGDSSDFLTFWSDKCVCLQSPILESQCSVDQPS